MYKSNQATDKVATKSKNDFKRGISLITGAAYQTEVRENRQYTSAELYKFASDLAQKAKELAQDAEILEAEELNTVNANKEFVKKIFGNQTE